MRFLLEQGLPSSTVQQLQATGLEADHAGPLELAAATDSAIRVISSGERAGQQIGNGETVDRKMRANTCED